jgi:hypothetical protein
MRRSLLNQLADVGAGLVISNMVAGASATDFVWSLVGPSGASINPSNGVLRWTPACSQGSSTNILTVWATDRARTNLSDLMLFTVVVKECVAPQLGRLILRAGDTGRLPIDLISSVALTYLLTFITTDTNRLVPVGVEAIAVEICETALNPDSTPHPSPPQEPEGRSTPHPGPLLVRGGEGEDGALSIPASPSKAAEDCRVPRRFRACPTPLAFMVPTRPDLEVEATHEPEGRSTPYPNPLLVRGGEGEEGRPVSHLASKPINPSRLWVND